MKLTAAQQAMVVEHHDWAMGFARREHRRLYLVELGDLEGWAALGLIDAVVKYDPARGGFRRYASTRVLNTMIDGYRDWFRTRRVGRAHLVSLDDMLPHVASSVEAGFDRVDDHDEARVTVRALPLSARQHTVTVMFGAGMSAQAIADELGVTPSRVAQISRQIRETANGGRDLTPRLCACGVQFVPRQHHQRHCSEVCHDSPSARRQRRAS